MSAVRIRLPSQLDSESAAAQKEFLHHHYNLKMSAVPYDIVAPVPLVHAHADSIWTYIEDGLNHIMTNPKKPLSIKSYSGIHTMVVHCTTSGKVQVRRDKIRFGSPGDWLYRRLEDYLGQRLLAIDQAASALQGAEFIRYYNEEWIRYSSSIPTLGRLFNHLNHSWAPVALREGKQVYPTKILALIQWRKYSLGAEPNISNAHVHYSNKSLTNALLGLVTQYREGILDSPHDLGLLKPLFDSFIALDFNPDSAKTLDSRVISQSPLEPCLNIYRDVFETSFLGSSENFFLREMKSMLFRQCDVPGASNYLATTHRRLQMEEDLASKYLHPSTQRPLIAKFEDVFIRQNLSALTGAFTSLLQEERVDDLAVMYTLVSRVPEGLESLRERYGAHVKANGLDLLEALPLFVVEFGGPLEVDFKVYVETLLKTHRHFAQLSYACFKNDRGFEEVFQEVFRDLVNQNAATRFDPRKSATTVGRYLRGLRNRVGNEDVGGDEYGDRMLLVEYLQEKDALDAFLADRS